MKVNVSQVRRLVGETFRYQLTEDFPPFTFGTDAIAFTAPVHVDLRLTNTGPVLVAQGTVSTCLQVSCCRCLDEFVYPLEFTYEDEWVYAPQATAEQAETALVFDKDELELGERIFEQIILALPMKFICSPDCQGLCLVCGQNLNRSKCRCETVPVDPRLAELANWQNRE